ncbi:MAG: hypothetical protein ISS19_06055 [Bacteroidales bacterium]|nr:hypothetical protein [Bacteroidales bacterium]
MKKIFAYLILACIALPLMSQDYVPNREDMDKFFKTKTMVVLDRNPLNSYDGQIQEAMENEWSITEFEFIPYEEFESKRKDPNLSFIMLVNVTFEKDKLNASYKFLNLMLGGAYYDMSVMPDLVSIPVSYKNVDEDSYNYKLGILVRFMQNHIKLMYDNPDIVKNNIFKYYNDNRGDMTNKKIYFIENELAKDVNSLARISKVFDGKVEIVSKEEIKEAIMYKNDEVVFLHKVGPEGTRMNARCYNILIGAGDANFYYFDYHMIDEKKPDGFSARDFKKLAK